MDSKKIASVSEKFPTYNFHIRKIQTHIIEYCENYTEAESYLQRLLQLLKYDYDLSPISLTILKYPDFKSQRKDLSHIVGISSTVHTDMDKRKLIDYGEILQEIYFLVYSSIKNQLVAELEFVLSPPKQLGWKNYISKINNYETFNFYENAILDFIHGLAAPEKLIYLNWLRKELEISFTETPLESTYRASPHVELSYSKHRGYICEEHYSKIKNFIEEECEFWEKDSREKHSKIHEHQKTNKLNFNISDNKESQDESELLYAEDYEKIRMREKVYNLTDSQARIVCFLHRNECYDLDSAVNEEELLDKIGSQSKRIIWLFKKSESNDGDEFFKTYIGHSNKRYYLNAAFYKNKL